MNVNEDTRFILRRLESLEGRLMREIKELQAFRNKALGIIVTISFLSGGIGAAVIRIIQKNS